MGLTTEEILQVALDTAGLTENPADSGVLVAGENIKKVVFGVDMETAEILVARELGMDAVITHHPVGGEPRVNMYKVMENQIERMVAAGVPINKAQKALKNRMDEVDRGLHVTNYDRVTSAAKALKMPLVAIHSPADLIGESYLQDYLDKALQGNPKAKLKDVISALQELPEYQLTMSKPTIRVGGEGDFAGRVFVTMAGGTSGGEAVYQAYFEAGIGTLVVMHTPESVLKAVKKQNIGNIIVAGHMASDSVGINQVIKALEAKGLEVTRMSGVIDPQGLKG